MAHERVEVAVQRDDRAINAEIGRRIEQLRRARGFKPAKFAHAVQISPQRLYWYEVGRNACPPAILARIAYVLVVSVADLVPNYAREA